MKKITNNEDKVDTPIISEPTINENTVKPNEETNKPSIDEQNNNEKEIENDKEYSETDVIETPIDEEKKND